MVHVGLTGGIATGKSTVARILVEKGARLIDLDEIGHRVQEPGSPVWKEIVHHFGEGILRSDHTIDRNKLGDIVFADREKLELLNRIVHPAIYTEWRSRIEAIRKEQPDAIVLSDIPLLIEAGLKSMVDLILLVYAPPQLQISRMMRRNGCSSADAEKRIASQMPIKEKLPFADIIVHNDGSLENTQKTLDDIWAELIRMRGQEKV
jgi:dephospho-CoA kinase